MESEDNNFEFPEVSFEKIIEIDNINKSKMKYSTNNRDIPVLQGFMFAANGAPMKIINTSHHDQKI